MNWKPAVITAAFLAATGWQLTTMIEKEAKAPQLTQLFKCTHPIHEGAFDDRSATLLNVKDRATGAEHLELSLDKGSYQYGGGNAKLVLGVSQFPADGQGQKSGIAAAEDYCLDAALPAHFIAVSPGGGRQPG